jgi:hypothetical protein
MALVRGISPSACDHQGEVSFHVLSKSLIENGSVTAAQPQQSRTRSEQERRSLYRWYDGGSASLGQIQVGEGEIEV